MKKEKGYFPDLAPKKCAYVCGPLSDLPDELKGEAKAIYSRIADLCEELLGTRGFVPHEHFDPDRNPESTPAEIEKSEREQESKQRCVLVIAIALAGSWGGGIEVEIAHTNKLPVIVALPANLSARFRRLRGNPAVRAVVVFENDHDLLQKLRLTISDVVSRKTDRLLKR